jgi:hypothetical protein
MHVRDGASCVSEGHVYIFVYVDGIMRRCSGALCAAHMLPPSVLLPFVIDRVTSLFPVPLKQAVSHLYGGLVRPPLRDPLAFPCSYGVRSMT